MSGDYVIIRLCHYAMEIDFWEGVFCRMRKAECGKLSRGNLRKMRRGFFLWNEG